MTDSVLAWHFVGATLRDGRPVPPDGEWLRHDGEMIFCQLGLHAAVDPLSALDYAPGNVLCRVECRTDIQHSDDKLICRERKILVRQDCTNLLRLFARRRALRVGYLWDMPAFVQHYLETGKEELRAAAWATATAVACDAARAAAWATATAVACDAARAASWLASWAVERAASGAADGAASWAADRAAARTMFRDMVHEAFGLTTGA